MEVTGSNPVSPTSPIVPCRSASPTSTGTKQLSLRPLILVAAFLLTLIALSVSLNPQRAVGATRVELACPNGLTVFLEGNGPPRTALLIFLEDRPVGGGSTGANGEYRLPLTLRERPGIYNVAVRTRSERTEVGQFSCYVDIPLNTPPTATPEIVVTSGLPAAPSTPTATPDPALITPTATAASVPGGSTATATTGTGYPPPSANATATPTTTPTPTNEPDEAADETLDIVDITLRESNQAGNPRAEFVSIDNGSNFTINLVGWQLVNTTRADQLTYTFPSYAFGAGLVAVVFSGQGADDLNEGEFYWGQSGNIWSIGDVAELRDNTGQVISSYMVGE